MKAIQVHAFGGPEVLKLEEIPAPTAGPGQLVVRVRAVGVNPVETYVRRGIYGPRTFPYTPGTDAAGEVESVGPGVAGLKPGDRVYTSGSVTGTYAEMALVPEAQAHRLPDSVSFGQGAALNVPYATAYRALLFRARITAAETVLIHGASGGVGVGATQIARAAGLIVVGTAGSEKGRQLVLDQGAHHAFNHHSPGYLDSAVAAATGGKGFDVIIEMLANENLDKDLGALAGGGRVVVVGNRGRVEIDARKAMARDLSILGMSLANATEHEVAAIHAAIYAGLENGALRPIVGKEFPLDAAAAAHDALMSPGAHGKIVLLPVGA